MKDHACLPVGLTDMADRLKVDRHTPQQWHHRGILPLADWQVSGRPAWCWPHTLKPWAERTGRVRHDPPPSA